MSGFQRRGDGTSGDIAAADEAAIERLAEQLVARGHHWLTALADARRRLTRDPATGRGSFAD